MYGSVWAGDCWEWVEARTFSFLYTHQNASLSGSLCLGKWTLKMSEVCRPACMAHWWEVRSTARVCRRGRFYCLRICVWWSRGRGSSFLSWKRSPVRCCLHTVTQRPLPRGAGSQGLLQGPSLPSTGLGFPHTPSVCPQPDVRFPSLETEHEPGVFCHVDQESAKRFHKRLCGPRGKNHNIM